MIKTLISLAVLLAVALSQEYVCSFDSGIGLAGDVDITTGNDDWGVIIDFSDVTDPSGDLTATGNNIHIHQYGFSEGEDCGAAYTGGHFNPTVNVGEISCLAGGAFNGSDVADVWFNHSLASIGGVHGILGRSLVVHQEDGSRVACCNIVVSVTADPFQIPAGALPEEDMLAACGPLEFWQDENYTSVTNWGEEEISFYFCEDFDCTVGVLADLQTLAVNQTAMFDVVELAIQGDSLFNLAGLEIFYNSSTADSSCQVVIKNAPANCGDGSCNTCVVDVDETEVLTNDMTEEDNGTEEDNETEEDNGTEEDGETEEDDDTHGTDDTHDHDHSDEDFGSAVVASIAMLFLSFF